MPTTSATVTIQFGRSVETFDRDMLTTAYLLYLDNPGKPLAVTQVLIDDYDVPKADAIYLTAGARICIEHNIEP